MNAPPLKTLFRNVLLLAIAAAVPCPAFSAPSQSSYLRPFEDIGQETHSGGYAPSISVRGVPRRGRLIDVELTGGAPNTPATMFVGEISFSVVQGVLIVPEPNNGHVLTIDPNGNAHAAFVWPSNAEGHNLAVQFLARDGQGGYLSSNAIVGTTLTVAEALALESATAEATGWAGISVRSVRSLLEIASTETREDTAEIIVALGALPNVHSSESGSGPFAAGVVSAFPISAPEVESYKQGLLSRITLGDELVEVTLEHETFGQFETYSIAEPENALVKFNSFSEHFAAQWPNPMAASWNGVELALIGSETGQAGEEDPELPSSGRWWSEHPWFGYEHWSCTAEVVLTCDGGDVNICDATADCPPNLLWDAEIGVSPSVSQSGDCCVVAVEIGAASGFKSVSVENGVVTITGLLGQSMSRRELLGACCPDEEQ